MFNRIKHFFIPTDTNDYKPHSLRPKSIVVVLSIAICVQVVSLFFLFPSLSSKINYIAAILPSVLIAHTNETRAQEALPTLVENPLLTAAAQLKANDMAARGYFAHVDPDGNQPWHYVQLAGYQYVSAGENLAVNFTDSRDVHRAWLNSPTHRANIVRPQFSEIGIATSRGTYKNKPVIFVVQFFAIPKEAPQPTTQVATTPPDTTPVPTLPAASVIEDTPSSSATSDTQTFDLEDDTGAVQNNQNTATQPLSITDEESQVLGETAEVITDVELTEQTQSPTWWQKTISAPRTTAMYTLLFMLMFVIATLLLKVFIEINIQSKILILHGLLLVSVLILLLILNYLSGGLFGEIQ